MSDQRELFRGHELQHQPGARRLVIERDDSPLDPRRDWDNLGVIATWHRRYKIGDEQPKEAPDEFLAALPEGTVILPVYMLDHSGLRFSTGAFGDPWDSGQLGVIYATPERVKEIGTPPELVEEALKNEIEVLDDLATGNVWGFRVLDSTGKELEACWGFIGDTAKEEIKHHLGDEELKALVDAAWADRKY